MSTNAVRPRCTTRLSSTSPAASAQRKQPGSSSACVTYSRRHGAHKGFGIAASSPLRNMAADDVKVSSTAAKPTCAGAADHPPVLESVSRFLDLQGFRVVGRARNGEEAIVLVEAQRPAGAGVDLPAPVGSR